MTPTWANTLVHVAKRLEVIRKRLVDLDETVLADEAHLTLIELRDALRGLEKELP